MTRIDGIYADEPKGRHMSSSSIQSSIDTVQKEIQSAQRNLTDKAKEEASKKARIAAVQKSISRHTSESSLKSKLREVERLQDDIIRIQKAKADVTKKVADKTARLHSLQSDLFRAQERERKSAFRKLRRIQQADSNDRDRSLLSLPVATRRPLASPTPRRESIEQPAQVFDVFISHASEDKDEFVRPLAEALQKNGVKVW